jgi:hypothetical protein
MTPLRMLLTTYRKNRSSVVFGAGRTERARDWAAERLDGGGMRQLDSTRQTLCPETEGGFACKAP